jgi:hypothetical protein
MSDFNEWPILYNETYPKFLTTYVMPPIAIYMKYIKTIRRYDKVHMNIINFDTNQISKYFDFIKTPNNIKVITNYNTVLEFPDIYVAWDFYQNLLEDQLQQ